MNVVAPPRIAPAAVVEPRWTWARRAWVRPLFLHVAALALVLLALVPVIGTGSSFSADEGAAIIQARSLSRGNGWVVEHPVPEADPTGANYPLELSHRGPEGTAPFAKHPLYALLLAGADRLGGVTGMVLLSLFGTVAAAALAALLAGRLDTALARPAVWAVGIGSPLLLDGYLVMAHTLGAALAAGAVLSAMTAFERRKPLLALAVAPCVAASVLLRTEAVFLGLGLAVAAAVVARSREHRRVAVVVAASALFAAAVASLGEAAWIRHILGGPAEGTGRLVVRQSSGLIAGRIDAFAITWLRPSYLAPRAVNVLLILTVVALALAAFVVRRHPAKHRSIRALSALAVIAPVLAVLLAPRNIVPGLLVACPLIVAGLVLVDRRMLAPLPARLAAVTSAVVAVAVLATQYETGGTGEWGGRYFSLILPVALPVILLAIRRHGSRALVVAVVGASLALATMSVGAIRSTHRGAAELTAVIGRTAAAVDDSPVVVTTWAALPRVAWATFDDQRWLLVRLGDVPDLVDRLKAAGIERFTFVARSETGVEALPDTVRRESSTTYRGWRILVLTTA